MIDSSNTAIETLRKNLYIAAENAAYDYQCEEVQQINDQLDELICRIMKLKHGKLK